MSNGQMARVQDGCQCLGDFKDRLPRDVAFNSNNDWNGVIPICRDGMFDQLSGL